jgi:hypothetical protein
MKEWESQPKFDGLAAFDALRNGKYVRRIMWTAGCFVWADYDIDVEGFTVYGAGTPRFERDTSEFPNMILEQLLEGGNQWELHDPTK